MKLVEITIPQVFDPPKKMLVWDYTVNCNEPSIQTVYAVIMKENGTKQAIGECCRWSRCADIPEEPKPLRATNRELSKWLSANKGEYRNHIGLVSNAYTYDASESDTAVPSLFTVRKWDDTEWHEPTVDYMGIEDKQVGTKTIARYDVTDKYGNQYSVRFTDNGLKVFPTPLSIEKSEEIISLARKKFPELENGNTTTFDEREISEADLLKRACTDKNFFKEYEVKAGNQIWMAKNLDINDGGEGIYFNKDNGEYYYTWEAAKRVADKITGWHLPSRGEWVELFNEVNTTCLMQERHWVSIFNVKPTGYWNAGFVSDSTSTNFWSSTIDVSDETTAWRIYMSKTPYSSWESRPKSIGFSVRLVKDR